MIYLGFRKKGRSYRTRTVLYTITTTKSQCPAWGWVQSQVKRWTSRGVNRGSTAVLCACSVAECTRGNEDVHRCNREKTGTTQPGTK